MHKFINFLADYRNKRIEKRSKPWGKKQKIVFLSVFGAAIVYAIVSMTISGNETEQSLTLPSLNLSVNEVDVLLLCLLGIGFAIFKIRAYIKRRKDNEK